MSINQDKISLHVIGHAMGEVKGIYLHLGAEVQYSKWQQNCYCLLLCFDFAPCCPLLVSEVS